MIKFRNSDRGKCNRSETPNGPSAFDISVKRVRYKLEIFVLYLNARKRNLEIAFLRYSHDFVTYVIAITEFDCVCVHARAHTHTHTHTYIH
jgi:hypothetical protein